MDQNDVLQQSKFWASKVTGNIGYFLVLFLASVRSKTTGKSNYLISPGYYNDHI